MHHFLSLNTWHGRPKIRLPLTGAAERAGSASRARSRSSPSPLDSNRTRLVNVESVFAVKRHLLERCGLLFNSFLLLANYQRVLLAVASSWTTKYLACFALSEAPLFALHGSSDESAHLHNAPCELPQWHPSHRCSLSRMQH